MKILFIVGPTASGKTALAEEIAAGTGAEIISADSRQVYQRLSVGTSKPSVTGPVKYHLVDFLEPDKSFSAGDFVAAADAVIKDSAKRGKKVIVAGGTGLYIRSIIEGITELPPKNEDIRKSLIELGKKHGGDFLHKKLKQVDPAAAASIHPNNIHRIVRALEVYEITKKPISVLHAEGKTRSGLRAGTFDFIIIGLRIPRQELYSRINGRAVFMVDNGMVEETAQLLKEFPENIPALNSVGYDRVIAFLKNKIDKKTLIEKVAQDTRNYAKRQMTWFNADKKIIWLDAGNKKAGELTNEVTKIWKG